MNKVLVTGAGGFIGSHLVECLVEHGYDVTALVRYNSNGRWGWLETIDKEKLNPVKVVLGDVRDLGLIRSYGEVDCIFHLAALIGIPYSYTAPESYVDTNIKGTMNMLEVCRETGAILIQTSTSEVYGNALYEPIDEKHPIQAQSPYAASKNAADSLVRSYFLSFRTPVRVVRPFNNFGPRQSSRAIIPTVLNQAIKGKDIKLGNIETERDFLYVKDTVEGFVKVLEHGMNGEVYNLGTGEKRSIKKVVDQISDLMGIKLTIEIDKTRIRPQDSEVRTLVCDYVKARSQLGWKPEHTFLKGLEETISWFRDRPSRREDSYHV